MATQVFKDGGTRFVEPVNLQAWLDNGWSLEGELPVKKLDMITNSNFSLGDVSKDPMESETGRLMRMNTERNIESGARLGEPEMGETNMRKALQDSAKIFDDVVQRDLHFYEEVRQYVIDRYLPDLDVGRHGILHALNRIESLYVKKEPITTTQVDAVEAIEDSKAEAHYEIDDPELKTPIKKRKSR